MKELKKLEPNGVERIGAVRTQVKLTNAVDDELVHRGMLAPRLLRECEIAGLVDTGAVNLVIPLEIAQQLGLRILSQQLVKYADGRQEAVGVTGPLIIECEGRKTIEDALVTGDEVLIGQVVLEKLDFLVDCKNQRLIPNPENPEYPVTYIKSMERAIGLIVAEVQRVVRNRVFLEILRYSRQKLAKTWFLWFCAARNRVFTKSSGFNQVFSSINPVSRSRSAIANC